MQLGIEHFTWSDLSKYERLDDLSAAFDRFVESRDADLFARFRAYRENPAALTPPQESALLIDVSKHLGAFLAQMFSIDESGLRRRAERDSEVARFKYNFVQKRVAKISGAAGFSPPDVALKRDTPCTQFPSRSMARTSTRFCGTRSKPATVS